MLKGMNQQWRRNIKKAAKAGVEVTGRHRRRTSRPSTTSTSTPPSATASRPRPLSYFRTMYDALCAPRTPTGSGSGSPATRATWSRPRSRIRVGTHAWYSYGASSTEKRDVRGSNAIQWAMIRDALAAGAEVYDLRGITDTLDADDPHVGLIQFKVGTGGEAVEYAGEWDLPLNRPLYTAFDLYMRAARLMSLTLTVDGERWRAHLRRVAEADARAWCRSPRATATASGSAGWLAGAVARDQWLGVDTLAVGTYDELPEVAQRFDGDLLVLTPWRPFGAALELPDDLADRVVHTVGRRGRPRRRCSTAQPRRPVRARAADLHAAPRPHRPRAARPPPSGSPAPGPAGSRASRCTCRSRQGSHLGEVRRLLTDVVAAGLARPDDGLGQPPHARRAGHAAGVVRRLRDPAPDRHRRSGSATAVRSG